MDKETLDRLYAVSPDMDDETYYKTISAKGKMVMQEKRLLGEAMHLAPLGFKNARDELGRSILTPDLDTFDLVQMAKRLSAKGMSIRNICRAMEEAGLRSKRGKVIGPSSMLKILNRTRLSSSECIPAG